MKEGQMDW